MNGGLSGTGRAAIVRNGIQFGERDASLLREVAARGSINQAAAALGRSQARSLRRIETLESAFGELVERTRGGSSGGGSRLTETGRVLLDHYSRIAAAIEATARMQETVLHGNIVDITGEMADVRTEIGTVRGIHHGVRVTDPVQVRIPSDALTVYPSRDAIDPTTTSARNHRRGVISTIESGETIHTVYIDVDGVTFGALITQESIETLEVSEGSTISISWKATATRLIESTRADGD